jgi:hypothetical protein
MRQCLKKQKSKENKQKKKEKKKISKKKKKKRLTARDELLHRGVDRALARRLRDGGRRGTGSGKCPAGPALFLL